MQRTFKYEPDETRHQTTRTRRLVRTDPLLSRESRHSTSDASAGSDRHRGQPHCPVLSTCLIMVEMADFLTAFHEPCARRPNPKPIPCCPKSWNRTHTEPRLVHKPSCTKSTPRIPTQPAEASDEAETLHHCILASSRRAGLADRKRTPRPSSVAAGRPTSRIAALGVWLTPLLRLAGSVSPKVWQKRRLPLVTG